MSASQKLHKFHLPLSDEYSKLAKSVTSRDDSSVYCKMCQKNEYHCERCRHRCHKKCQGHSHRHVKNWAKRSSSFNRIRTAGDEHWTKVLQANDCYVPSCSRHCSSLVSSPRSATDREFGSLFPGLSRSAVAHSNSSSVSRASSFASSKQKPPQLRNSPSPSSSTFAKESLQANSKEKNVFHSLYSRFMDWIESGKLDKTRSSKAATADLSSAVADACAADAAIKVDDSPTVGCGFPREESDRYGAKGRRCLKKRPTTLAAPTTNLSSSESDVEKTTLVSRWRTSHSRMFSRCPSSTATSPCASVTSDFQTCGNDSSLARSEESDFVSSSVANSNLPPHFSSPKLPAGESTSNASSSLESATSASSLSSRRSGDSSPAADDGVSGADAKRASFRGRAGGEWMSKDTLVNSSMEKDSLDVSDGASICTILDNCEPYLRDSLKDWNISFCDIKLKEILGQGSLYTIYKGQWHGDIAVYLYDSVNEARVPWFLREVSRLSKIRHENICLFMGACFNNNNMAVVTSELRGMSVYERLHLSMDRMPSRTRVGIARHVAQAVGYLHARNLTARTLSTRNVYFEPKVKLSLMDRSGNLPQNLPKRRGLFLARGVLGYMAPEFLRKLKVYPLDPDSTNDDEMFTFETDSFAFGSLLYELLSCHVVMKGLMNEEGIWMVCSGRRQDLSRLGCNPVLKVLIDRCWSHEPRMRPSFIDINQELMQKTGLHKRHSSSQPDRLDHRGSFSLH